jgi:hypothetical protein
LRQLIGFEVAGAFQPRRDFAVGSGAMWPDFKGDPEIDEGSHVIVGAPRHDTPTRGGLPWCSEDGERGAMIGMRGEVIVHDPPGVCPMDQVYVRSQVPQREGTLELSAWWPRRDCVLLNKARLGALQTLWTWDWPGDYFSEQSRVATLLGGPKMIEWLHHANIIEEDRSLRDVNGVRHFRLTDRTRLGQLVVPGERPVSKKMCRGADEGKGASLIFVNPSDDGLSPEETDLHDNIDGLHNWLTGAWTVSREYWGPSEDEILQSMAACLLASRRSMRDHDREYMEMLAGGAQMPRDARNGPHIDYQNLIFGEHEDRSFGGGIVYDEQTLAAYREQKARLVALAGGHRES